MSQLEVNNISINFGGIQALSNVNFHVDKGELIGLIGPNGAGKSTVFNVLTGVYRPSNGKVIFENEDITGLKTHKIAKKGLVKTFQETLLFKHKNVYDNVEMGNCIPSNISKLKDFFNLRSATNKRNEYRQETNKILSRVGLENVKFEQAKDLPHGYQRAIGMSIALSAKPKLLCLDEPVTGMNLEEIKFITDLICNIREEGTTVLLVEHCMKAVMGICDRIVVLNFGEKIAEGTADEICSNEVVINAYLGGQKCSLK